MAIFKPLAISDNLSVEVNIRDDLYLTGKVIFLRFLRIRPVIKQISTELIMAKPSTIIIIRIDDNDGFTNVLR